MSHPRPWHRGSLYGEGARLPRDREQRARYRYLIRCHLQAHRISHACAAVAEALLRRLSTEGQLDPSHATLASDACCSTRTVARSTATMLTLGLLSWTRRLVREGPRAVQTSNAYCLLLGGQTPVPVSKGHDGSESRSRGLSLEADMHANRDRQLIALGFPPVG